MELCNFTYFKETPIKNISLSHFGECVFNPFLKLGDKVWPGNAKIGFFIILICVIIIGWLILRRKK